MEAIVLGNMKKILLLFLSCLLFSFVIYSCSSQRSMATNSYDVKPSLDLQNSSQNIELQVSSLENNIDKKVSEKVVIIHKTDTVKENALAYLSLDKMTLAMNYWAIQKRIDSLNSKVESYKELYLKNEREKELSYKNDRINEEINNNIVKYALGFVLLFSILSFVYSYLTHRTTRKSELSN